ncbi:hypothetical protein [Dictyobacter aurantiacus]|uniref:Uncharacterized protein n=1 Tax=Dictyobacter aurantiacus TaxID=1936993 RepID=A0A401ZCS9_9CHLR|nr:hypothetical protein [Dictyobacter aurantiacus]GCE04701.1 hypothetical protein KDAU_20300 [Dictyobacter aurantiacus]
MSTTTKKDTAVSTGICSFCQTEVSKARMTQHLKHCQQRLASFEPQKKSGARRQTGKLLHLLVEGQYNPQYWMHIEIPASESLLTLDDFLRATWLECCDHMSDFTINGIHYTMEPDEAFVFLGSEEEYIASGLADEEEEEEEYSDEQIIADALQDVYSYLQAIVPEYRAKAPYDLLEECARFTSVDELILFLQEKEKSTKKRRTSAESGKESREDAVIRYLHKHVFRMLLGALQEDRDMDVELAKALRILKPGAKFFHRYDFGSTTYLALRVIDEREGLLPKKNDDAVQVMARNCPPEYPCVVCGKPAQLINTWDEEYDFGLYCKQCAKKKFKYTDEMLPVVNSPRVGVCAYTGD